MANQVPIYWLEKIRLSAKPFFDQLSEHPLYRAMATPYDVCVFMEHHVFAVWDFMSLLKCLQRGLTYVDVPWVPNSDPKIRRLINQIVVEEESDVSIDGVAASHFELYREAMADIGADLTCVDDFVAKLREGMDVMEALAASGAPLAAAGFVAETWKVIETGSLHRIAAAFTFGREKAIPTMFDALVRDLDTRFPGQYGNLRYYLDRHIELDGDSHGHLAEEMLTLLCGDDPVKWQESLETVKVSLAARAALWDAIADIISEAKLTRAIPS